MALELATAATATLQGLLQDVIARADHQVLAVLVGATKAGEAEQVARGDAAHAAAELDALVQTLQRLDAIARVLLAVTALHVGTRVVVQRIVAGIVRTRHDRAHVDARAGALEVVVVEFHRARLHVLGQLPVVDVVTLAVLPVRREVGHAGVTGCRHMRAVGIGQYQHVAIGLVAEVVVDALLLHQPADEVEAGFAVLHAVLPLAVRAAQRVFEIGEPQVAEHLLDDLRHAHVLEDAAVGGAAEQPKPGPQGDPISRELAAVDALPAGSDDAVEMPVATAMLLH